MATFPPTRHMIPIYLRRCPMSTVARTSFQIQNFNLNCEPMRSRPRLGRKQVDRLSDADVDADIEAGSAPSGDW